jgi:biotin carboxyl carrier protein
LEEDLVIKTMHKIECLDNGTIEQVYIQENSYVYEWEKLFLLKTLDGKLIDISIGASGYISEVHVTVRDHVTKNSILAVLQDDFIISGSD